MKAPRRKRKTVGTDRRTLIHLLETLGVEYVVYADQKFLCNAAVMEDATSSISIRFLVDFYFDKKGKFVGNGTLHANSFQKRAAR